jgi:hypothetical protein
MTWSHQDSWEVDLVLHELIVLERQSERVNLEAGAVTHGISFERERAIPGFHAAVAKRFDFSVMVDQGKFRKEFLIEIHGNQHYELSFLGDKVRESDRMKEQWARAYEIPLLVLRDQEVVRLHLDGKLGERIRKFLGASSSQPAAGRTKSRSKKR